jgi:hypothetical protein
MTNKFLQFQLLNNIQNTKWVMKDLYKKGANEELLFDKDFDKKKKLIDYIYKKMKKTFFMGIVPYDEILLNDNELNLMKIVNSGLRKSQVKQANLDNNLDNDLDELQEQDEIIQKTKAKKSKKPKKIKLKVKE